MIENWLTGSIDVGYRAIPNISGDRNTYRSAIDLGEGPKLLGLDAAITEPSKRFFDRIDVTANSWGGDPYNTARIEARKQGVYDFTWDYRNIAYFDFLPSFADPTKGNNVFLDQQGFDTFLRTSDFELDLRPGHSIVPYVAYSRNGSRGDGTTNFALDANEYTLPTTYSDYTNLYRGGVRFEFNRFHATLEQGAYNYTDSQSVTDNSAALNLGNLTTPYLGTQLALASAVQLYRIDASGIFSKAQFTASPASWIDFYGQFLYSQPKTKANFNDAATGTFFDFNSFAFYSGMTEALTGQATQPHSSGSVGFELRPFHHVRIMEAFMTDRSHDTAASVLAATLLASGGAINPSTALSSDLFVVNYNQQEANILFDVTSKLTVRLGHRYIWGDTSEPAALVFEGQGLTQESSQVRRNVALAGLTYHATDKLRVSADFEASPGDNSFFRTSLNDYQRGRVQARYQMRANLQFTAEFSVLNNRNPDPAIAFDYLSRYNAVSAYWTPSSKKKLSFLAEYARSTLRSNILYLLPTTFTSSLFAYRDNEHTGTLAADIPLALHNVESKLTFGGSFFVSSGSRPTEFYEPFAKVSVPLYRRVEWYGEWRWYGLSQPFYLYEGFRSNQILIGLHAGI
jgi:hypothetical protein